MRLFNSFPILFFVVAAIVISNDIFHYSPAYVLKAPLNYVVPLIMIIFGVLGYMAKNRARKQEETQETNDFFNKDKEE